MDGDNSAVLRNLTRVQAWILLTALVLCCLWSMTLRTETPAEQSGPSHDYSDVRLYRDIAAAVAGGQGYYTAAISLQRLHGFPTTPFVTVRPPTLVLAAAALGWKALQAVLMALLLAGAFAWYARLDGYVSKPVQVGAIAAFVAGGAMVTQAELVPQHDQWAGILLATALAFAGGRVWPLAVACAALALAIRELAIAFVLLALAFALFERRWREAVVWCAIVVAFVVGMTLHAAAVQAHLQPGDLRSHGWTGLRGPAGTITDLIQVSLLNAAPPALAAPIVILALFGWAGAPNLRLARFALLWLGGFGAAIAIFARDDNLYWAIELLPAWFVGLAFLPGALGDLATVLIKPRTHSNA